MALLGCYGVFLLLFFMLMSLGAVKCLRVSTNKYRKKYSILAVMTSVLCLTVILELYRHFPRHLTRIPDNDSFEKPFGSPICEVFVKSQKKSTRVKIMNTMMKESSYFSEKVIDGIDLIDNVQVTFEKTHKNNFFKTFINKGPMKGCLLQRKFSIIINIKNHNHIDISSASDIIGNSVHSLCFCGSIIKKELQALYQQQFKNRYNQNNTELLVLFNANSIPLFLLLVQPLNNLQDLETKFNSKTMLADSAFKARSDGTTEDKIASFFSSNNTSFGDVLYLAAQRNGSIPTAEFLRACISYMKFFDRFSGTIMLPVKMDIKGNVGKIEKFYKALPDKFYNLQDLLLHEKSMSGKGKQVDSPTEALAWLTRSLNMMCQFLKNLLVKEKPTYKNPSASLQEAYTSCLMKHHSWFTQKLFLNGMSLLGNYNEFLSGMIDQKSIEKFQQSGFSIQHEDIQQQLIEQGLDYSKNMSRVVQAIFKIYKTLDIVI